MRPQIPGSPSLNTVHFRSSSGFLALFPISHPKRKYSRRNLFWYKNLRKKTEKRVSKVCNSLSTFWSTMNFWSTLVYFDRIWSISVDFGQFRFIIINFGRFRPNSVGFGRFRTVSVGYRSILVDFSNSRSILFSYKPFHIVSDLVPCTLHSKKCICNTMIRSLRL